GDAWDAFGRGDRGDPAQHDRRARPRAARRAAARQGRPVQRARTRGAPDRGGGRVNFSLTDEQTMLREAAREALSRLETVASTREALDGGAPLDLWPTACDAGWTGLLIPEDHGGAGL